VPDPLRRADLLAAGRVEDGDCEPAKSDWEDLQAKSRTDPERMEALGRLLQEESVEGPQEPQGPQQRQGTTACDFRGADFGCLFCRQASLVSRLDFDAAAGCGSASLTDGRCEALQGLARPTFRPRVKRRRSIQTRALVLPKKPVNLVFALETWLEGTHQH
ncbi:unnamed protein product, partial [Effrenium voratum]